MLQVPLELSDSSMACAAMQIDKSQEGTGDNHAISALKFKIILEFLELGWNVLLSDVDIVVVQVQMSVSMCLAEIRTHILFYSVWASCTSHCRLRSTLIWPVKLSLIIAAMKEGMLSAESI